MGVISSKIIGHSTVVTTVKVSPILEAYLILLTVVLLTPGDYALCMQLLPLTSIDQLLAWRSSTICESSNLRLSRSLITIG